MPQPPPPTNRSRNRSPSRQSTSAAQRTASWFLRGSKLPTHRTSGSWPGSGAEAASEEAAASTGSAHSVTSGPTRPCAGSIWANPRNSLVAETLMPATADMCLTAVR